MKHLSLIAALLVFAPWGMARGQEPAATSELYRVKEVGGGLGIWIDQTVIFSLAPGGSGTSPVRLIAERLKRETNWCGAHTTAARCAATKSLTHDWIDSASCPAIRPALAALSDLPLPPFKKIGSSITTVTDTPLLTIEGVPEQSQSTAVRVSISEFDGPHGIWWTKTEEALAACWTHHAPEVDGRPVQSQLSASPSGT